MEAHLNKPILRIASLLIALSLILAACTTQSSACEDPLGCVQVGKGDPIKIGILLTLTGPDSPYGIDALRGADVFYGLSVANVLTPEMIKTMANDPIVFAMANPNPEIKYELARQARPDALSALIEILNGNRLVQILAQQDGQIVLREADQALLSFQTRGQGVNFGTQIVKA